MNWFIFEDSLENREGHWFEYLDAFVRELPKLGDKVTIVASERADKETLSHFKAMPLLPQSVFSKMRDGASELVRGLRIPWHAWRSFWRISRFLKKSGPADLVFVPTVTVHHLLAWYFLIHFTNVCEFPKRVLLFFVGFPSTYAANGVVLDGSPSGSVMKWLLRGLYNDIQTGRVILGVETAAAKESGEKLFGVPFRYFPHPVGAPEKRVEPGPELVFGCYGAARHEKGSDIFVQAVMRYLERYPETQVRFVFQWVKDFSLPNGQMFAIPEELRGNRRVEIIARFFEEGEYALYLEKTSVMVLPYRSTAYGLRGSRVLIEAMLYGIPSVVSRDTTLEQQLATYGGGLSCREGNIESLVNAMRNAEENFQDLKARSMERVHRAIKHHSVAHFRSLLEPL